ncbi:MAG: methyltransferase [Alphaproteobacteria bacterium]
MRKQDLSFRLNGALGVIFITPLFLWVKQVTFSCIALSMSMACETLFYWIRNGSLIEPKARVAFLNASYHHDIGEVSCDELVVQQHFKPFADDMTQRGVSVLPKCPDDLASYDVVLVLLPKSTLETEYYIACALRLLKKGGLLVCSADNKAGGSRLKKTLQKFGLSDVDSESRNKARVVWGRVEQPDISYIDQSYQKGLVQPILDARFVSEPGVFGWNKVDKGSEILTTCLPKDLKGKGADFGCGYGYLSDFILSHRPKVKRLHVLDADYRAVQVSRTNLSHYECPLEFIWCDLTKVQNDLRNLDFVIMNPPFHEGKKTDNAIGQAFIQSAYASLKRGGRLWMVANNHLPYEDVLEQQFFEVRKHYEGQGFKVYEALK